MRNLAKVRSQEGQKAQIHVQGTGLTLTRQAPLGIISLRNGTSILLRRNRTYDILIYRK